MKSNTTGCIRIHIGLVAVLMAAAVLTICMTAFAKQTVAAAATPTDDSSYLGQAKKFLDSGMQQTRQSKSAASRLIQSAPSSDVDPRLAQMLSESIKTATDLINNYRQNGLSSMPNLPNLPGISTIMRVPDKLLRAELSMLQDEIRMAQEMMNNPLAATMNAPRDIASMFMRMAEQLEQ